ncbi:MAG: DEAD/DEAH box helicase, partial [Mycobacteriaceae bacterium]|nr:DEAD/DEAH box helicase [Mycobacteriaceae bacterium]
SDTADEPALVLRLLEPDEPAAELWRLEVCLRAAGEAPRPVSARGVEPQLLRTALSKLGDAMKAYPRLRDVPADPDGLDLLLPTAVVIDLVRHGAEALQSAGVNVLLPRAWRVATPSLRLSVSSPAAVPAGHSAVGMNELVSYRWQLSIGDIPLTDAEMARLVAGTSDLVRLRDDWVQVDRKVVAGAARYITGRLDAAPTSLASVFAELTSTRLPDVPITDVSAQGWVAGLFEPAAKPAGVAAPAGLKAQLRPYQQRGLDWLVTMSERRLGALLADDMGLGKTVQVLALLAHELDTGTAGPTLLVCPMSVVGNWEREAATFVPALRVLVHHGTDRLADGALAAAITESDLVITTYSLVAKDLDQLRGRPWRRVVLDEAQHIKNANTAQSRAVRAIEAEHRVALSGTPVENRLEELRSILDFANPKLLGSPQTFRARFAVPIERERDSVAATRLRTLTAPFVLRRVKTDPAVISDLPEKLEMTVRANLTTEQAALYEAVLAEMLRRIDETEGIARKGAVLSALTRLKQVCNHPAHFLGDGSGVLRRGKHRSGKLALVDDVLDSVLADGEKALLFTQFREFGALLAPYLADRFGGVVPFLHGGVPKRRRDAMVAEFQSAAGPPLMLLSLKAGGTGLNLTAANHVVHLDRWWNPAVENQATDRAFRIGQTRNVQVRKLVCVGTVEERIDDMLADKAQLADLAVGAGENWITELGGDQLRELMALGSEAIGE